MPPNLRIGYRLFLVPKSTPPAIARQEVASYINLPERPGAVSKLNDGNPSLGGQNSGHRAVNFSHKHFRLTENRNVDLQ